VYRPTDQKAFTYPPFFALPFVPLALVAAEAQRPVWWFCNLSLAAAVVGLVSWLTWPIVRSRAAKHCPPIWLNVTLVAILSAKFVLMPLAWESHDLIVLVLVLLSGVALARNNQPQAGIWAGLAAACKATPLLLLPLLL